MADYEIRDVMNRRRHPKLEFKMKLVQEKYVGTALEVKIRNIGQVVPRQYGLAGFAAHGRREGRTV